MDKKISKVLSKLELLQLDNNPKWNITRESGIFLNTLVKALNVKNILEIGTSNGYSGIWFAEALQQTGGKLTTVESHNGRFLEAQQNFTEAGLINYIEQILGHAPEAIADTKKIFDIIFFDATKNEHLSYFEKLENKLAPKGLLISDNVISHKEQMINFLETINKSDKYQNSIIPLGSGLMLSLKKHN